MQVLTWNTDAWWYGSGTASLYQLHPWFLAVLPNGEAKIRKIGSQNKLIDTYKNDIQ